MKRKTQQEPVAIYVHGYTGRTGKRPIESEQPMGPSLPGTLKPTFASSRHTEQAWCANQEAHKIWRGSL